MNGIQLNIERGDYMSELVYDNEPILHSFSEEEKSELFEQIVDMYYKKNFGSTSKADLETYLFSFYLEHLIKTAEDFSDYVIGKDLGLTISRVRSLKERKELKYPSKNYEWKTSFLECSKYARYDETKHLIKFTIPDVNVIKDVRYFLEKNNLYDEYQLNAKLFQCPLDVFIEIGKKLSEENGEELYSGFNNNKIQKLIDESNNENEKRYLKKLLRDSRDDGLKNLLINGGKVIITEVLKSLVPGASIGKVFIDGLIEILKR